MWESTWAHEVWLRCLPRGRGTHYEAEQRKAAQGQWQGMDGSGWATGGTRCLRRGSRGHSMHRAGQGLAVIIDHIIHF
jgi:hypothetical protein